MRETVEPTINDEGAEQHPAWGLIGASRVQSGGGKHDGAVLFDSEIPHRHYVVVKLHAAQRKRDLNRDWIGTQNRLPIVEVAMSESQWAQFVSSMNQGDGVPCTITTRDTQEGFAVPGMPYSPRLQQSMDEVASAADKSLEKIREAFALVKERPNKTNIRNLEIVLGNAPANMKFAAKSLTEHTENVVTKARADLEAMVIAKAKQLGLDPEELGVQGLLGPATTDGEEQG